MSAILQVEPLTRSAFRAFGYVIQAPGRSDERDFPTPTSANQSTALRYGDISFLASEYHKTAEPARPVLSLFSCSPRLDVGVNGSLKIEVLEKHPFTSQTFAPLGLGESDSTCYLVIVAPTLASGQGSGEALPDLSNIKVFVANGSQAVTYAAGTWHAPMIVIGHNSVNFLVTQFMNSVPEDNCQEFYLTDAHGQFLVSTQDLGAKRRINKARL